MEIPHLHSCQQAPTNTQYWRESIIITGIQRQKKVRSGLTLLKTAAPQFGRTGAELSLYTNLSDGPPSNHPARPNQCEKDRVEAPKHLPQDPRTDQPQTAVDCIVLMTSLTSRQRCNGLPTK